MKPSERLDEEKCLNLSELFRVLDELDDRLKKLEESRASDNIIDENRVQLIEDLDKRICALEKKSNPKKK